MDGEPPPKLWERPWTTDEMRENASNWSLAGDAGLLKHLQSFSQKLLARTHDTSAKMDSMFDELHKASTDVGNTTNAFLSLANTQFVENRVYEDEDKEAREGEGEKPLDQAISKEAAEAQVMDRIRESLANGMAVMDSMFHLVEVPGSDSEDEGSSSSVVRTVLEPKNRYLHRPLPHLIGSAEFTRDDRVGLGELLSDDNESTPRLTAHSSVGDLNQDLPPHSPLSSSDSDSVASDRMTGRDSAFDTSHVQHDMFGGDSLPRQQAESQASFAEQLAAKLGGVAAQATPASAPPPAAKSRQPPDDMFSPADEEEDSDSLFGRAGGGKFSGGRGLFDDVEQDEEVREVARKKPDGDPFSALQPSQRRRLGVGDPAATSTPEPPGGAGGGSDAFKEDLSGIGGDASDVRASGSGIGKNASDARANGSGVGKNVDLFGNDEDGDDDVLFSVGPSRKANSTKKKMPAGAVPMFGSASVLARSLVGRPPSTSSSASSNGREAAGDADQWGAAAGSAAGAGLVDTGESGNVSDLEPEARSTVSGSFDPVFSSTRKRSGADGSIGWPPGAAGSDLFAETVPGDDSLFRSSRGGPAARAPPAAKPPDRKPLSLFHDSDSGDEEMLFSSTSSPSVHSRLSGASDDRRPPPLDRSLFAADHVGGQLFGEPDVDLFAPTKTASKTATKTATKTFTRDDIQSKPTAAAASASSTKRDEDIFARPAGKDVAASSTNRTNLFDFGGDASDDIFVVPSGYRPRTDLSSSLFDDVEDLFASPAPAKSVSAPAKSVSARLFDEMRGTPSEVDDLFASPVPAKPVSSLAKPVSLPAKPVSAPTKSISERLFDEMQETSSAVDDLFESSAPTKPVSAPAKPVSPPAKPVSAPAKSVSARLFEEMKGTSSAVDDLFASPAPAKSVSSKPTPAKSVVSSGLFDEMPESSDAVDDLFASPSPAKSSSSSSSNPAAAKSISAGLFDETIGGVGDDLFASLGPAKSATLTAKPDTVPAKSVTAPAKSTAPQQLSDELQTGGERKRPTVLTKPEPPRTLNIRQAAQPDKPDKPDKPNKPSVSEKPDITEKHEKIENSKTTVPDKPGKPDKPDDVSKKPDKTENKVPNLSRGLNIDPTALLPGAKPRKPGTPTAAESKPMAGAEEKVPGLPRTGEKGPGLPRAEEKGPGLPRGVIIDPTALLPGAKPPPRSSMDGTAEGEGRGKVISPPRGVSVDPAALLPGARQPTAGTSGGAEEGQPSTKSKGLSFDEPVDSMSTLHSAVKERAKIPVKRRPQSRHARQEAIRTSAVFSDNHPPPVLSPSRSPPAVGAMSSVGLPSPSARTTERFARVAAPHPTEVSYAEKRSIPSLSGGDVNPLSPSTDEEDLFGVPQGIYDAGDDAGGGLFGGATVLSPRGSDPAVSSRIAPDLASADGDGLFGRVREGDESGKIGDLFPTERSVKDTGRSDREAAGSGVGTVTTAKGIRESLPPSAGAGGAGSKIAGDKFSSTRDPSGSSSKAVRGKGSDEVASDVFAGVDAGPSTDDLFSVGRTAAAATKRNVESDADLFGGGRKGAGKGFDGFDPDDSLFGAAKVSVPSRNTDGSKIKADLSKGVPSGNVASAFDGDDLFGASGASTVTSKNVKSETEHSKKLPASSKDASGTLLDDGLFTAGSSSASKGKTEAAPSLKLPDRSKATSDAFADGSLFGSSHASTSSRGQGQGQGRIEASTGVTATAKRAASIFDEDLDAGDLFSSPPATGVDASKKEVASRGAEVAVKKAEVASRNKSLFDDDDEDIFSSGAASQSKAVASKPSRDSTAPKKPVVQKSRTKTTLKTDDTFDDPLMALMK